MQTNRLEENEFNFYVKWPLWWQGGNKKSAELGTSSLLFERVTNYL
jgi:hypothetical protein